MKPNSVGGRGFQRKQMPLCSRKTTGKKREYITVNGYHFFLSDMDNMAEF